MTDPSETSDAIAAVAEPQRPAARVREAIRNLDWFLLVARLTLVLAILNTNEHPLLFVFTAAVAVAVFLNERALNTPWLWFGLFAAMGTVQLADWYRVDDHIAVTTYWVGAVGLSRLASDPRAMLATTARLLIGLVFLFAFGWKVGSGQFADATFFRYTLIADDRFEAIATSFGGIDDADYDANQAAISSMRAGAHTEPLELDEGPRNQELAAVMTGWGILIEVAIAAAFLLPLRWRRTEYVRCGLLLAFGATTYAVIPVGGFGSLLLVLGLAQSRDVRLRDIYVVGVGAVLAWSMVWYALFG